MMIARSPGPGIIPYTFRVITSVLLGAQIHRQRVTPPGPFDNPVGAREGVCVEKPGEKISEYPIRRRGIQYWMTLFQTLVDEDYFTGDYVDVNLIRFAASTEQN